MSQLRDLYDCEPGHLLQIYADEAKLVSNVTTFLREGARGGNGLLIIAEPDRTQTYLRTLRAAGGGPEALKASGRLIVLDAADTLEKISSGRDLNSHAFHEVIGGALHALARRPGQTGVRVYGEMAGLLWRNRRYTAAARLERFWNGLLSSTPAKILCSCGVDVLSEEFASIGIQAVLAAHGRLLPSDSDGTLSGAFEKAMDEVFGPRAAELRALMHQEEGVWPTELPEAEAAILWLYRNSPAYAGPIVARTRLHAGLEERERVEPTRSTRASIPIEASETVLYS